MQRTLIGLSLASLILAGCGKDSPESMLDSAQAYLAKGDGKAALIQIKNALQQEPDLVRARLMLGRVLLDGGDPVGAEVELRKAQGLNAAPDEVVPLLMRALAAQGKYKDVLESFSGVALSDPKAKAVQQLSVAQAHLAQGRRAQAKEAIQSSLSAQPDLVPAMLVDAWLKGAEGDVDGALQTVDRARQAEPANAEVAKMRGDLLQYGKARPEEALAAYRQGIELDGRHLASHAAAVQLLMGQGKLPEAQQQFAGMKERFASQPQTRLIEAQLAFQGKDFKKARELSQDLLRKAPDNVAVLQLAGAAEFMGGSLVQAEAHLAKALQLAPRAEQARKGLVQVYLRTGQSDKALATLAPAIESQAADPALLALAGQAHLQHGDAAQALKYFEQAAKLNPADVRSRTVLALADVSRGQSDAGFAALEALAGDDKGTTADMALISAHVARKEYGKALQAIAVLERKTPDRPDAALLQARVELLQGQRAQARASFERALKIAPNHLPAIAGLAGLDLLDKQPEAARGRFEKLIAAEPGNVRARLALAELRARTGASRDDVAALLSQAVQAAPADVGARRALVEFYLRGSDARRALSAAQEANAAVPDQPDLLDALGRAQMQAGDVEQALTTFGKVATLRPQLPEPQVRIAEARLKSGNAQAAREALAKALQLQADHLPAQQVAIMLELSQKQPEAALKQAGDIQRQRPQLPLGFALAGDIEMSRGRFDQAAAAYRTALGKAPAATELATKLHGALLRAGKAAEADRFAASWTKDHPKDSQFLVHLGGVDLAGGNLARAEQRFARAAKAQPTDAIAHNNLAWVLSRQGKPGALELAEKANSLAPNQPPILDTLAAVLAANKQYERAIETQKQAMALQPQQPTWRLNLAKILLQAGQRPQAEAELKELEKLGDKFPAQAEVKALLQGK